MFEVTLAIVAILLILSAIAGKAASWIGVPALVFFLLLGMLLGSDGPGGIYFSNAEVAREVGMIALAFILYSGGLDTRWNKVRDQLAPGFTLATAGVLISAGMVGAFSHWVLGFTWLEGLLLGSIIASTDAAAVFSTLRGAGSVLQSKIRSLLEIESGSNDPIAIFLTITLISLITQEVNWSYTLLLSFFYQMLLGALFGFVIGKTGAWCIQNLNLENDSFRFIFSLGVALLSFAGVEFIGGNGFLAAYVAGLAAGQQLTRDVRPLRQLHDAVAWLMQIAMFLVLGLLVFPRQLPPVAANGILLALFLILIARPAAVVACLAPFRFNARETAFASWTGLRGAVPIVLAIFPLLADIDRAQEMFNLVFFVVIVSALIQGPSSRWLARRLKLEVTH